MIIFLDTETTGIRPGQICQLSYIMQDKERTFSKNFFFSVDKMDYGAFMVHGFSIDKLRELSNGKTFADYADEIIEDINRADLVVAHNVSFDSMFLRTEFERLGVVYAPKKEFCTMKKLTPICKLMRTSKVAYKYPKLSEACEFFCVGDTEIKQDVNRLFGETLGYHDARFDTTALYLVANHGMEKGLEELKDYL